MNNIKEQNGIKFFKETTMEELEEKGFLSSQSVFLKFGDNVLIGITNCKYQEGEVKRNHIFKKLELNKISKSTFEDTGHAIEWAMKNC